MSIPWTIAEDDLVRGRPYFTAKELAPLLPGRTTRAILHRRGTLGLVSPHGKDKSPLTIAGRTLIAKTCRACGLLLPAEWFKFREEVNSYRGECRKCGPKTLSGVSRGPNKKSLEAGWRHNAQAVTAAAAVNAGNEYTESDHAVLSNAKLSNFTKALMLGRTYYAVRNAVEDSGYVSEYSYPSLGDTETESWVIANPNIDRIDEITATLRAS